jgi:NAD(P)-dependent dehydrogenase (short-subunit alcohol dehydrogenase family)
MTIRFDGQVAIVTGAGNGLGKSHALELAKRGAKVVINDLGGSVDGVGASSEAAKAVVAEIEAAGGEAISHGANVANFDEVQDMVTQTMAKWGRVDILINNAGILRDKSFSKMSIDEFKLVVDVHLMGSVNCSKAVWDIMREQEYGRILMTTSSSGMYGNFGQANYGAAKMALVGLMNTLVIEGKKKNIHVNCLAPTAGTRMLDGLVPQEVMDTLTPSSVTAGALTLCHKDAPTRLILCAGGGGYASTHMFETDGVYLPTEKQNMEEVIANYEQILDTTDHQEFDQGFMQTEKFMTKAMAYMQSLKGEK